MKRRPLETLAIAVLLAATHDSIAQISRQITDHRSSRAGSPSVDHAGSVVYAATSADEVGVNPLHSYQIVRWNPLDGAAEQVTDFPDGVGWTSRSVSVSDDGQWLAFLSPADPLGQNHDESLEAFVMRSDGSLLSQITSDPASDAGSVLALALAGSGSRVAFVANADPLGSNPGRLPQLFVVDRGGTGLRQLTSLSIREDLSKFTFSIGDDGQRIVFSSRAELIPGGNPDGGYEVYAILSDGTGLRQLTASSGPVVTRDSMRPVLSGDGAKVAFESTAPLTGANPGALSHVFVVNWDGTNLMRLSASPPTGTVANARFPWIDDDGEWVVYSHDFTSALQNPDGNPEIWKVRADGTGRVALTATPSPTSNDTPVLSGNAGRVVYTRDGRRRAMDGSGGNDIELGLPPAVSPGWPGPRDVDVAPDGSRVVFEFGDQIWRVQTDRSDMARITEVTGGPAVDPSISGDGELIAFSSYGDPLGENTNGRDQIFVIGSDGTGLRQLTDGLDSSERSLLPDLAGSGTFVVFQSSANLGGLNPSRDPELFRIRPNGTDLLKITVDQDDLFKYPRVDDAGVWVTYQSASDADGLNPDGSSEVFVIRTDGSGLARLTSDPVHGSNLPDISASGSRIVWVSKADPFGTNPDHNAEVFLHARDLGATQQLTFTTGPDCRHPRISGDGRFVYFTSAASIFEHDPDGSVDGYRIAVDDGVLERVGAIRRGPATLGSTNLFDDEQIATDATGNVAVLGAADGDWVGQNPDCDRELVVADFSTPGRLAPSRTSPTVVRWDPDPRALRYDVIRGRVADLGVVGNTVELGAVVCLEDDSPDLTTAGFEDSEEPAPGEAFFFLHRGSQGVNAGSGSFGQGSGARERSAGSGDCAGAGPISGQ